MSSIFFLGHADAGFVYMTLKRLNRAVADRRLPEPQPLAALTEQQSRPYGVVVPLQRPLSHPQQADVVRKGLERVAADVDAGFARVLFDYSNESGNPAMLNGIEEVASQAGIRRMDSLAFASQNRLLGLSTSPVTHLRFDAFPALAWLTCVERLQEEATNDTGPRPDAMHARRILCLNATPRFHRFVVLLALADAGLIDLTRSDVEAHCQIPYVSFPGFSYVKQIPGTPDDEASIVEYLSRTPPYRHLVPLVRPLLDRLPLRIDDRPEQGNALAMAVDIAPYRASVISVVTETSLDAGTLRITEKTMKPLALGHPLVSIGTRNALTVARDFGYTTFDQIVDHSYDEMESESARLLAAVASARSFVDRYESEPSVRARAREESARNIDWTLNGFGPHYWRTFAARILEFLQVG